MLNMWKAHRDGVLNTLSGDYIAVLFSGDYIRRSEDASYTFSVNRNFYYLTGINRDNCALVIRVHQGERTETLYHEIVNPTKTKWVGPGLDPDQAKNIAQVDELKDITTLDAFLADQLSGGLYETLYLDLPNLGWNPNSDAHTFAAKTQTAFPYMPIRSLYPTLCQARLIKDNCEIEHIRKAIEITDEGLRLMWKNGRPGMTEGQWESWFNFALMQRGVRATAFPTIACAGPRSVILHYDANDQTVEDGQLLLTDLGAHDALYAADITRTVPSNGHFNDRQRAIYNAVLAANEAVYAALKPGYTSKEMNELVKKTLAEGCRSLGLIENEEDLQKYYYHGAGHPLGLDVHDVGGRDLVFKPGMVITVEPGLYIAEEGTGVRIEDNVLITETGCEVLSAQIPRTAEEIEAFMQER